MVHLCRWCAGFAPWLNCALHVERMSSSCVYPLPNSLNKGVKFQKEVNHYLNFWDKIIRRILTCSSSCLSKLKCTSEFIPHHQEVLFSLTATSACTALLGDSEHIDVASSVFVQAKIANGVQACAN